MNTRYVHWDEPGPNGNVHFKITVDEAIRIARTEYLKKLEEFGFTENEAAPYKDASALEDFLAIHWAVVGED